MIPANAPHFVVRFQNRANRTRGANAAPKPAHAKETMRKMMLSSSKAIRVAMMVIKTKVIRETIITCLSVAFFLKTPWKRFFATEEAAINR